MPVVGLGTKLASGWGLPGHRVTATTSRLCCCSPCLTAHGGQVGPGPEHCWTQTHCVSRGFPGQEAASPG